jgi:hypothetical protein
MLFTETENKIYVYRCHWLLATAVQCVYNLCCCSPVLALFSVDEHCDNAVNNCWYFWFCTATSSYIYLFMWPKMQLSDTAGCCYVQLQLHLIAVVECRSQSHFLEQTTKQHSYRTWNPRKQTPQPQTEQPFFVIVLYCSGPSEVIV